MSTTETNDAAGTEKPVDVAPGNGTDGAADTTDGRITETGPAGDGDASPGDASGDTAGGAMAGGQNAADARELGDAGAQLSTAPREESAIAGPALGVFGWIRWFWRQLTSMRVALILLFLLSLGAIPGSLIPQQNVDSLRVQDFQAAHKTLTPIYEKLQLFTVFSSVWFSAIYILLFVSLIGCIIPRSWTLSGSCGAGRPRLPDGWTGCPRIRPGVPRRSLRRRARKPWRC